MVRRIMTGLVLLLAVIAVSIVARSAWNGLRGGSGAAQPPAAATINPGSIRAVEYNMDSYKQVAERGALSLWVNDAGHIRLRNAANGSEWNSLPSAAALESEPKGLWRNHLQSPFLADIVDVSKRTTGLTLSTLNLDDAKTKTSVQPVENGATIEFDLQTQGIRFAVTVTLEDGYLDIRIPADRIQEKAGKQLVSLWPYPFFGAVKREDVRDGQMLVPIEMGALIPLNDPKQLLYRVTANLYGSDITITDQAARSFESPFPTFGMAYNGSGYLAVIEEGETTARVNATPSGLYTAFHWISPQFIYRQQYFRQTSKLGAGYKTAEKELRDEDRRIRYYFQSGADADYVGMAAAYRGYLQEKHRLTRRAAGDVLPVQLSLYGGAEEKGLFRPKFVAGTTFDEGRRLVESLHEAGVGPIDVTWAGWSTGGDQSRVPAVLPAESKLGGTAGLERAVRDAHDKGDRVFLQTDYTNSRLNDRFVPSRDALRSINNRSFIDTFRGEKMYVNPADVSLRLFREDIAAYRELGIDGLKFDGIGHFLFSDFRHGHVVPRKQSIAEYRELLGDAKEQFASARIGYGNAYTLGAADHIANMPMDASYDMVATKSVPFYPIALHGLVTYSGAFGNLRDDRGLLRSIEYGAGLDYMLTQVNPNVLKDTTGGFLYSSEFAGWKDTVVQEYGRWKAALGRVQNAFIVGHRELAKDVMETRYDNGVAVLVNYRDTAYTDGSVRIGPKDFTVVERRN
ncbi:DUF5696 domain-containing protein [Paenibacillus sp. HJGM_3]|uniref:DUF5696 domain-containing protein n=1 Tax=Paenibacillus sp. HJGM_3 TaxID=3379816 RepID=UPI00385E34A1